MTRWFRLFKISFILLFILPHQVQAQENWKTLIPGLQYTTIKPHDVNPWGQIHVFQIDLKKFKFNLALANSHNQTSITVQEFAKKVDALLVINGGFFTPKLKPIGLRINNGVIESSVTRFSWSGIFYITKSHLAKIIKGSEYRSSKDINFAIQSGPRLIIDDKIPKLSGDVSAGDVADRTALGITNDKKIIVLVTEHFPLLTSQLAQILQKRFHCKNALNLDGGRSSQIYASINDFLLSVENISRVSDVVWVSRIPVIAKN